MSIIQNLGQSEDPNLNLATVSRNHLQLVWTLLTARVFVTDTTVSVAPILLITPIMTENKFDGTFLIMVIPPYLNWLKNKGQHFRNIYLLETILFFTRSLTAFQVFIWVHFIGYNS